MKIQIQFLCSTLLILVNSASIEVPTDTNQDSLESDLDENPKIVGGTKISINQAPFQAALLFNNRLLCGGSIISGRWILTAAHCVPSGLSAAQLRIRVGSSDYLSGGQVLGVVRIVRHPRYDARNSDYDVAVLQVNARISGRRTISLSTSEPGAGRQVRVTGWGSTQSGGMVSRNLRAVTVPVVGRAQCERDYGRSAITARMICAGTNGKDACQGDSGGPLSVGNVQYGVVSWGQGCGARGKPGVYANVANLRSWIGQYARL